MDQSKFISWEFLDFFNNREENEILTWLNSIPLDAKAMINARIASLRGFRIWPENFVSAYKGWDEIIELKIRHRRVQYRPLGFYGPPGRWRFTLLAGGVEKGKLPKRLLRTADERRKIILANVERARPHDFS